jgi:hypothetical protein
VEPGVKKLLENSSPFQTPPMRLDLMTAHVAKRQVIDSGSMATGCDIPLVR